MSFILWNLCLIHADIWDININKNRYNYTDEDMEIAIYTGVWVNIWGIHYLRDSAWNIRAPLKLFANNGQQFNNVVGDSRLLPVIYDPPPCSLDIYMDLPVRKIHPNQCLLTCILLRSWWIMIRIIPCVICGICFRIPSWFPNWVFYIVKLYVTYLLKYNHSHSKQNVFDIIILVCVYNSTPVLTPVLTYSKFPKQ